MEKHGLSKALPSFFGADMPELFDPAGDETLRYCGKCGQALGAGVFLCEKCGCAKGLGNRYCKCCGQKIDPAVELCMNCGQSVLNVYTKKERKSRVAAGLLGVFLGGAGLHSFYLGNVRKGVVQLAVTVATCGVGALWGFVEGVMILADYIDKDAKGVPLD